MSLFGNKEAKLEAKIDQLTTQFVDLTGEVAKLETRERDLQQEAVLSDKLRQAKTELENARIENARIVEDQDRKRRETEHEIGLLRKQVEWEREQLRQQHEVELTRAKVEVTKELQESNEKVITEKLDFMTKRFDEELKYLKDEVLGTVLKALPNANLAIQVGEPSGGGNGTQRPAAAAEA